MNEKILLKAYKHDLKDLEKRYIEDKSFYERVIFVLENDVQITFDKDK